MRISLTRLAFPSSGGDGPILLAVKIDDKPGPVQTPRDPIATRRSFMKGLGAGRDSALDA